MSKATLRLKLRSEVLVKLRKEVRRIVTNDTAQGRRYAYALCRKYRELVNA
jgi:hypothetical protein